ncbi:MAG: hypothetical protein ABI165_00585 [Bryobacteraceae bacterium]
MAFLKTICASGAAAVFALSMRAQTGSGAEPVRYMGGVSIKLTTPEGNLRPAIGVENRQVLRANRTHPELSDGFGWTYNHAPMLAYWNGKFYLEYLSNPLGEQVAPGQTLLMTSRDGRGWSKPEVVFPVYKLPDGNSAIMHQRMGFYVYHQSEPRLLVLAFYGHSPNPFGMGGIGRVVREAYKDGRYGPVYFIRYNRHAGWNETNTTYPFYKTSPDKGFVAACDELLRDKLMTLQWWQEDQSPGDFYTVKGNLQALSFYHRKDGKTVALWKHSLAALSSDEGRSWTTPVKLPTVIMSGAKIWGQRTKDGRYALVYNPVNDSMRRYPLAIVTGGDGIHFDNLLFIGADLAPRRFSGNHKDFGLQYVRGIEEGNGAPPGNDLRVAYSVNKEDLWVARVPVPVRSVVTRPVKDNFDALPAGGGIPDWNIYSPLWAPVRVAEFPSKTNKSLELDDRNPYDYARAVRVFPESKSANVSFKVYAKQADTGRLEIEVMDRFGNRPARLMFTGSGRVETEDGSRTIALASYQPGKWYTVDLRVDAPGDAFTVSIDGKPMMKKIRFAESVLSVERVSFRTGPYRTGPARDVDPEKIKTDLPDADDPAPEATYYIDDVAAAPVDR